MSQRFVCALLTASVVCCALAENNELAAVSEFVKKQSTEDKPSSNVVHGKNSSKTSHLNSIVPNSEQSGHEKNMDKHPRTINHRLESDSRGSSCCGSRYGSNSSTRPDSHYSRIPGDSSRYPTKFGERLPFDRYGWQTQGSLSGSIGRPGSGNYAGTAFYEGSQAGDRFGSRPSYGSEGSRKPGGYDSSVSGGYGYANSGFGGYSFNRPTGYAGSTGGYGISGTFANGDEFGPVEPNRPEGHTPSYPNINAQKAVALKALAGVALIGAAAALATNPVLLPLGVVSGRRKRSSVSIKDRDAYMNYIMNLKSNVTKLDDKDGNKISVSPTCVARLTCEIQKNYWINRKKDANFLKERSALERHLNNLLLNSVPNEEFVNARIKSLVKAATIVASNGENCSTFTCTFLKNKKAKSFVFKL
ncbi:5'-3' exoribonuclease 2-like [Frieseomelitta varia]|uniref:5'-3' exoribonuclease 2-like n=1 Tax=Frieseomelitta varia TaxID=561572 RepID=UPI001CB6916B|nr:5'-3' exoribonuclease 2-like [Frieseomelitta varia]XP_043511343.1 5'-3' exoribonuclease 2-like [Frieseomelitta varia]